MINKFIVPFLVFFFCATSCAPIPKGRGSVELTPSDVITNGSFYNGKTIKVVGFSALRNHRKAIWQSKEKMESGDYADFCISLLVPTKLNTEKVDMTYVQITGIYINKPDESQILVGGCNSPRLQVQSIVRIKKSKQGL